MREFKYVCLLSLVISIFISNGFAGDVNDLVHREIYFTSVPKVSSAPKIDGNLNDACWQEGTKITKFLLTAGKHGKPAETQTTCYLFYDDTHLYVAFKCEEPDISAIKTTSKMWDDLDILYDDRVEIFLDINHDHRSYFELAVNPSGVQFDQKGFNRFHGSKTCDMYPEWNCFWRAKTSIGQDEWDAEIAIDVTSLGIERIEEGMTWGLNLARVRQPDVNKGDEFFKRKPGGSAEYSAWVPVKDYIRETISNFHAPIEFGDVVFGDPGFEVKEIAFKSARYAFGPLGFPSEYGNNPLEIQINATSQNRALMHVSVTPATRSQWKNEETINIEAVHKIKTQYWIPEDLENLITIQLLDPDSKKQLYRTSYWELTPPFIEYNLEQLYSRTPSVVEPVQFRLLTDEKTLKKTSLELTFIDPGTEKVIAEENIEDLSNAQDFQPIFDIEQLRALKGGNYVIDAVLVEKSTNKKISSFRQSFTKFDLDQPEKFHAIEGDYSFGGITAHGIQIHFPSGVEYNFWKKASYIPWWDIDGVAASYEFVECWGAGNQGCNEPMQDRETRYSRVTLLENTDARVVVHWRYALSDPHYKIYRNEWVDEYYYLYPDGVGTREVNLWPNSNTRHEMFEILLIKPPGVKTHQLFDEKFATLSNLDGEGYSNIWLNKNREFHREFITKSKEMIVEVHFKDRLHPFACFALRPELLPGVTPAHVTLCARDVGHADRRGHWPASRFQIDGYNTPGLDVPHHGNIGNIQAEIDSKNQPTTWKFLIGASAEGSQIPYDAAKSWLYPGDMKSKTKDVQSEGYLFSQRAYAITIINEKIKDIQLILENNKSTIMNPAFILKNMTKEIKSIELDNQHVESSRWVVGKTRNDELILFIKSEIDQGQTITIRLN